MKQITDGNEEDNQDHRITNFANGDKGVYEFPMLNCQC